MTIISMSLFGPAIPTDTASRIEKRIQNHGLSPIQVEIAWLAGGPRTSSRSYTTESLQKLPQAKTKKVRNLATSLMNRMWQYTLRIMRVNFLSGEKLPNSAVLICQSRSKISWA